jgi:CheY-like chemotaxis protein
LEAAVWTHLEGLLNDPATLLEQFEAFAQLADAQKTNDRAEEKKGEAQLRRLAREEQLLLDAYQAEVIDLAVVNEFAQNQRVAAGPLLCTVSRGEEILREAHAVSQMAIERLQTVLNLRGDPEASAVRHAVPTLHGILLAEDEPALRALLECALCQEGIRVWAASDGVEALALFQQHRSEIGLVLLDVQMPRLDGPQTLTALQQLVPDVRWCFMTSDPGTYSDTELRCLGADRTFQRPVALDLLTRYCGQILDTACRPPR